ncbi:MAG TPA: glycosyltransferase family 1 protein [Chitinophagaceae bacterium]|nr:glycosyltransferase family 1 protein [Chitinophagaceae bacterium]
MRLTPLRNRDVVCFSHLRWNFVYQRPQHLLSRIAEHNRVLFVEEPIYTDSLHPYELHTDADTGIRILVPLVPENATKEQSRELQQKALDDVLQREKIRNPILWYYSPMALSFSDHLRPLLTVYDCMDELSAFRFAPAALKQYEAMLFNKADIVFTGGHHLYEAKKYLHENIHPFPSSIDKDHFARARRSQPDPPDQADIPHPRIGFYGVIDERFNVRLLNELSSLQPGWHFVLVGPTVKIDASILPKKPNVHLLGQKTYRELPAYLAGWDVAMMPFALNESTKYISPTKTPEYLAGGKPVVSTSIRDVVTTYGKPRLVRIADTVKEFEKAISSLLKTGANKSWLKKVDAFLATESWDNTYGKMAVLIQETIRRKFSIGNRDKKKEAYV